MRRILWSPQQDQQPTTPTMGMSAGYQSPQQPRKNGWSITKQQPLTLAGTPQSWGQNDWLGGIARSIAQPFVKTAVTGAAAIEATGCLAMGDQAKAEEVLKTGGFLGGKAREAGFTDVGPAKIGTDVDEQMKTGKGPFGRETLKTVGTGAEIAATLAPGGGEALVAKEGATAAGEQIVKQTLGQAIKTGAKEAGVIGAVAGFGSSAQKEGATGWDVLKGTAFGAASGAAVGAAMPLAQTGIERVSQVLKGESDVGSRLINSLIKPLKKDFSYGKNPGRGISAEGITGNSLEELAPKITQRRNEIGQEISQVLEDSGAKLSIPDALSPIESALKKAKRDPETNSALITRLEGLRSDLLGKKIITEKVPEWVSTGIAPGAEVMRDVTKEVPAQEFENISAKEAFEFKKHIGDLTKFTGNQSDDTIVNSALKQAYGKVKGAIEEAVPSVAPLNERYADLTSAEVATKYRDVIEQRQPLIKMGSKVSTLVGALGGALASGGAALPAILTGAGAFVLDKALESPAVLTRAAAWLSRSTPQEVETVFATNPAFRNALIRAFNPGSTPRKGRRLLRTQMK